MDELELPPPKGTVISYAKVLDFGPSVIDDGYIECIFGSPLGFDTFFRIGGSGREHPMSEQIPVAPGNYDLHFRTVSGIPAPAPLLNVPVVSGEVTVVAVIFADSAAPPPEPVVMAETEVAVINS